MSETNRFATGVLKGRPLESTGLPYKIISYHGEEVAQFQNGALARFYADPDPVPIPPAKKKKTQPAKFSWPPEQKEWRESIAPPVHRHHFLELLNRKFFAGYLRHAQATTISAFRTAEGRRPTHYCEPAYAITGPGGVIHTVDRMETGTGVREYLWLYDKLRELGRGRLAAIWEAKAIYFL